MLLMVGCEGDSALVAVVETETAVDNTSVDGSVDDGGGGGWADDAEIELSSD